MQKLDSWIEQKQRYAVKHFPKIIAELLMTSLDKKVAHEYAANLIALKTEFSAHFLDFKALWKQL